MRRRGEQKPGVVRRVPVEASRELLTVGPDAKAWSSPAEFADAAQRLGGRLAGSLVRLRPPAGTDPTVVRAVRESVLKLGAEQARVVPAPRVVVATAPRAPVLRRSLRQVAEQVAAEATTEDRPALAAAVDRALAAAGL